MSERVSATAPVQRLWDCRIWSVKIEEFSARYSGPAVDDHSMDVSELGPALLALGELHRAAFRVLLPNDEHVPRVKVEQVRPGSFEIMLSIDLSLLEHAKQLFTDRNLTTGAALVAITGVSLKDVVAKGIGAVKARAMGRKKTLDELSAECGNLRLARVVFELQDDRKFVKGVKGISSPMNKGDVESLELSTDAVEPVVIDQDEAAAIDDLRDEVAPHVEIKTVVVEVDTPHIRTDNRRKWRFYAKDYGTFTATMLDQEFMEKVHSGAVVFRNGMKFQARLRVEEWDEDGRPKRRYEVVQIDVWHDPDEGEQLSMDDI